MSKHPALPPLDDEILLPARPSEVMGWGRLCRIVRKFPSEQLEVIGALSLTVMGFWFLTRHLPTGGVLAAEYPGKTHRWGAGLLLLSLYKWWAVLYGYEQRIHRLVAAAIAAMFFFGIMMAYIRRAPNQAMIVVMALWIVHQVWIAYRSQKKWSSQ